MKTKNEGWTCPQCGRVYAPSTYGCDPCSSRLSEQEQKRQNELWEAFFDGYWQNAGKR